MATTIRELRAEFTATTGALEAGAGRAKGAILSIGGVAQSAGKGLLYLAGAGAALYAGLKALEIRTAAAGDQLAKMSSRTGMSIEFLSEMKYVLGMNDASLSDLTIGMRAFSQVLLQGGEESKTALTTLKALGITAVDVRGKVKPAEQLFTDAAKALGRIENATVRAAYAQRIFGRGAESLIPTVLAMGKGFESTRKEAHALGVTWSTKDAQASEQFMDNLGRLKSLVIGLGQTFAKQLIPEASDSMAELVKWGKTLIPKAEKVGKDVAAAFAKGQEWLNRQWPVWSENARAAWAKIKATATTAGEEIQKWWTKEGPNIKASIESAWADIPTSLFDVANSIYKFGEGTKAVLAGLEVGIRTLAGSFLFLADQMTDMWQRPMEYLKTYAAALEDVLTEVSRHSSFFGNVALGLQGLRGKPFPEPAKESLGRTVGRRLETLGFGQKQTALGATADAMGAEVEMSFGKLDAALVNFGKGLDKSAFFGAVDRIKAKAAELMGIGTEGFLQPSWEGPGGKTGKGANVPWLPEIRTPRAKHMPQEFGYSQGEGGAGKYAYKERPIELNMTITGNVDERALEQIRKAASEGIREGLVPLDRAPKVRELEGRIGALEGAQ